MGLFKTFRDWETKYALTFMGLVVGLLFGGFGVYVYFQKTSPNLRFEEISRANVIDVKEDVGKLDILYNGVNLRDKHQTLALVTLKVSNDGAAPIPKAYFDDAAPVGLEVTGAEITKAEVFNASNPYLTKNTRVLTPTNSPSLVTFVPVTLEPGDSFWLKLLLLYNEKGSFEIKPTGKIAGVKQIAFASLNTKEGPPAYWKQVVGGGIGTQLLRLLAYFFGPLFVIGTYVSVTTGRRAAKKRGYEIMHENDRKEDVAAFKAFLLEAKKPYNPRYEWVLTTYITGGTGTLKHLTTINANPEILLRSEYEPLRKKLLDVEAVQLRDNKVEVNPLFTLFIADFSVFLTSRHA